MKNRRPVVGADQLGVKFEYLHDLTLAPHMARVMTKPRKRFAMDRLLDVTTGLFVDDTYPPSDFGKAGQPIAAK